MNTDSTSPLLDIDWYPNTRKIRQFAGCLAIFLAAVAWYAGGGTYWWWCGTIALAAMAASWFTPTLIKPLYLTLMLITLPIGLVVGEAALIAIYLGVFLPIGLLFRWLGRDALQRTIDRNAVSYWDECCAEPTKKSYLRRY